MGLEKLDKKKRLEISKMGSEASAKKRTIVDEFSSEPDRRKRYNLRKKRDK